MWVRRFRDIRPSRRDDPYYQNVPDGYSVNSVSSVFKKMLEAPPRPSPVGRVGWRGDFQPSQPLGDLRRWAGAMAERDQKFNV